MDSLPNEVIFHISSFLPWKSWKAFRATCALFFKICSDNVAWRTVLMNTFCGHLELRDFDGDCMKKFRYLSQLQISDGMHDLFLLLDDTPLVRRSLGLGHVFVLKLDFSKALAASDHLLTERSTCLVKRIPAVAPWGDFDCVTMQWGTLFSAFGFFSGLAGASVYCGRVRSDSPLNAAHPCVFGSSHSTWNDVTGSFHLRPEQAFLPNVRDNEWGDAFCDFHSHRTTVVPHVAVGGCSWNADFYFLDKSPVVVKAKRMMLISRNNSRGLRSASAGTIRSNGSSVNDSSSGSEIQLRPTKGRSKSLSESSCLKRCRHDSSSRPTNKNLSHVRTTTTTSSTVCSSMDVSSSSISSSVLEDGYSIDDDEEKQQPSVKKLVCVREQEFLPRLLASLVVHVESQWLGGFKGHGFGSFAGKQRLWSMRGVAEEGAVSIAIMSEDLDVANHDNDLVPEQERLPGDMSSDFDGKLVAIMVLGSLEEGTMIINAKCSLIVSGTKTIATGYCTFNPVAWNLNVFKG